MNPMANLNIAMTKEYNKSIGIIGKQTLKAILKNMIIEPVYYRAPSRNQFPS
jgi:DNA anti-recombination protein RmuC